MSGWMDPRGSDMEGGGGRGLEGVCTRLHTVHQEKHEPPKAVKGHATPVHTTSNQTCFV